MRFRINRSRHLRTARKALASSRGYGLKANGVNILIVLAMLLLWAPQSYGAQGKTILALGDSLTAGYGLPQGDAFPAQLQAALARAGQTVTVINGSVSGDTSAGGRSRLTWLLGGGADAVDAVILELGANDGLRGLDPGQTRANLDWILATLKKRSIPVLITGMMAPPNLGADYGAEFNSIYGDLARKYGAILDPFYLQGVVGDPTLNQADGIHPNALGVAVIVKRMVPKVQQLLKVTK